MCQSAQLTHINTHHQRIKAHIINAHHHQRTPLIYDLSTATERQSTHYRPTDQLTMINRSTLNPHTDQLALELYRTLTKITRTYATRTSDIRIIYATERQSTHYRPTDQL